MESPKWQTWNVRSVLSHVRMPEAFGLQLGLFEYAECKYLRECLIGRPEQKGEPSTANDLTGIEDVHSEARLIDAHYTGVSLTWREVTVEVRSACIGDELYLLVEPRRLPEAPVLLTLEAGVFWGRPGGSEFVPHAKSRRNAREHIVLHSGRTRVEAFATSPSVRSGFFPATGAHMAFRLDGPVGICTGRPRALSRIRSAVERGRCVREKRLSSFGRQSALAGAMYSALGWTTNYNAGEEKLTTTCSRVWASRNGGGILFDWDTFLAGMMAAALGERTYAHAFTTAIVDTIPGNGYVPNVHNAVGAETLGQSQPTVGAMCVRYAVEAFGDIQYAAAFVDNLLTWNRWWPKHRDVDGYLCWGSNRLRERVGTRYERLTGNLQGARFESGLDNSPMYDDVQFDTKRGIMLLADVGLMSFYVKDCIDLAWLLGRLGRTREANECARRAEKYAAKLEELWDDARGIYLNRDLATGEFSPRRSPTLFYPLFTGRVDQARARRMTEEHLLNPSEFWGEHVIPSISRDDQAYGDQSYWRGRIWAPMNLFVYWGLKLSGLDTAATQLARKSAELFMRSWTRRGMIGENYNALTGETGEKFNSDPFNPWGALLALTALIDAGKVPPLPTSEATGPAAPGTSGTS